MINSNFKKYPGSAGFFVKNDQKSGSLEGENIDSEKPTFLDKTKNIFNKICSGIKWAYLGKYKWWFIIPSVLILIYILYFIVVFRYNARTFAYSYGSYSDYDVMKGMAVGVGGLVLGITLLKVIYDLVHHKFTCDKAIIAILILGVTIRIVYMLYTPIYYNYGTWRQHDLGYGNSTTYYPGHYGIIINIYRYGNIPDMARNVDGSVNFEMSGQLYQPKLSHILYAIFMHINSIFVHFGTGSAGFLDSKYPGELFPIDNLTMNEYALFEMNRILACFISCWTLFVLYKISKEFKISNSSRIIALLLFAFTPVFFMFSTSLNNDNFSFFFGFIALLYAIRWFKKGEYLNSIMMAVALGLGMSCKLSIGFFAFVIGGLIIYRFIKVIKYSLDGPIKENAYYEFKMGNYPILNICLQIGVFALLVFPIGLSYPIYAKIRFDQPFNYVWLISDYNWNWIDSSQIGFFRRFMIYPSSDFFKGIFVENHAWIGGEGGYIDPVIQPNLWNYVLKSSLFGEYSWNYGLSAILYVIALILMFSTIGFMIYLVYKMIKDKKGNIFNLLVIGGLGLTYLVLAIQFNIQYPFTCSMDYRYFVPFTLVVGLCLAFSLDNLKESKYKIAKYSSGFLIGLVASFSLFSYVLYLA